MFRVVRVITHVGDVEKKLIIGEYHANFKRVNNGFKEKTLLIKSEEFFYEEIARIPTCLLATAYHTGLNYELSSNQT